MEANLLDTMLTSYRTRGIPVTIHLQTRARVSGIVRAFDNYVILLANHRCEIVYRHAISSIGPATAEDIKLAPRRSEETHPLPRAAQAPTAPAKHKPRTAPRGAGAPAEPSLNTTMKEGLLRWMQEQKAAK